MSSSAKTSRRGTCTRRWGPTSLRIRCVLGLDDAVLLVYHQLAEVLALGELTAAVDRIGLCLVGIRVKAATSRV